MDLASLIIISVSLDEVLTDSDLRAEDNKIYKRVPKHPNPEFMMTIRMALPASKPMNKS